MQTIMSLQKITFLYSFENILTEKLYNVFLSFVCECHTCFLYNALLPRKIWRVPLHSQYLGTGDVSQLSPSQKRKVYFTSECLIHQI